MEDPIVEVNQGFLRGANEKNVYGTDFVAFRGIPYAKPPIGELRFKDSVPVESWFGVRDATKFGGRCAQKDSFSRVIVGGDDCLYLNIYTLNLKSETPKAVMVWIHGGAFIYGSGDDELYGPDYLVEKDIVLVTINYRLGILGFLNIEDPEAPGNQGLKDQVTALKWVQENIKHFGGDSNNVTIFGESAGGASVHYLTISPMAQGLFHKAIIQSGCVLNPWASLQESPMESVNKLAAALGQDTSNIKEFVNYLRSLDTDLLIETEAKLRTFQDNVIFRYPFIPSVDSKAENPFLTKPVEEAANAGIKVPCLCGYLSHEGLIIISDMKSDTFDAMRTDPDNFLIPPTTLKFLKKFNITIQDVQKFYFGNKTVSTENTDQIVDMLSDAHFVIGLHHVIETQTKFLDNPTYFYKFEYEFENSFLKQFFGVGSMKGTCHAEELRFLFFAKITIPMGIPPPAPDSIEYHFTQKFTELWTNFAKTGNPTPSKSNLITTLWEPINSSSNQYNFLKITDELVMTNETNKIYDLMKTKSNKL